MYEIWVFLKKSVFTSIDCVLLDIEKVSNSKKKFAEIERKCNHHSKKGGIQRWKVKIMQMVPQIFLSSAHICNVEGKLATQNAEVDTFYASAT